MKTSQMFRLVKQQLILPSEYAGRNGSTRGDAFGKTKVRCICYAIDAVWRHNHDVADEDLDKAHSIIWDRLGDNTFLENWVSDHIGPQVMEDFRNRHGEHVFNKKMQATRHAWVNSLIAEFAAKGD